MYMYTILTALIKIYNSIIDVCFRMMCFVENGNSCCVVVQLNNVILDTLQICNLTKFNQPLFAGKLLFIYPTRLRLNKDWISCEVKIKLRDLI